MSYADVFLMLAILFAGLAALAMMMRRPPKMADMAPGH